MANKAESFDAIIVGGGSVGLTMAVSLTQSLHGIRVALLDRRPVAVPVDRRASAISADVRRALEALGIWGAVAAEAQPIRRMTVTDSGPEQIARPRLLQFGGHGEAGNPFAHMVPNTVLTQALLNRLADGAEIYAPVEVLSMSAEPGIARLALVDGRVLTAPLVIAADGARSALRDMAGIGTFEHDYRQSGIVATITHELDHEGTAYEHFRPAGPFASLPLPGRRSSLVWTEASETASGYKDIADDELARIIEEAMGSTLGTVALEDRPQVFPLRLLFARSFVAPRLALIGDAAHVVHPLAGQGLNLGLRDVAALAEVVIGALRLGLDHGSAEVLRRYETWRRVDTTMMAAMTDGLNRLFSNDIAPVRAIRDFGLSAVDRMPMVKDGLIAAAAGRSNSAPKLLQGEPI